MQYLDVEMLLREVLRYVDMLISQASVRNIEMLSWNVNMWQRYIERHLKVYDIATLEKYNDT